MNTMNYKEYARRAYETASRHGFHDKELSVHHWLMMVITEVAEMVEADRRGRHAQVDMFKRESTTPQPEENKTKHWLFCFETFIKDSFEDEMADTCIRLFDLAGLMGWTIEPVDPERVPAWLVKKYNEYSVTEIAFELCRSLTPHGGFDQIHAELAISMLICWAKVRGIDLEWHIAQKMEYNEQREILHGNNY